jgi:hypothetical protein
MVSRISTDRLRKVNGDSVDRQTLSPNQTNEVIVCTFTYFIPATRKPVNVLKNRPSRWS